MLDNAMVSRIRFLMRQTLVDDPEKASPGLGCDPIQSAEALMRRSPPRRQPSA
jgi:hypothetical protein